MRVTKFKFTIGSGEERTFFEEYASQWSEVETRFGLIGPGVSRRNIVNLKIDVYAYLGSGLR
jgi:hypothetical protein